MWASFSSCDCKLGIFWHFLGSLTYTLSIQGRQFPLAAPALYIDFCCTFHRSLLLTRSSKYKICIAISMMELQITLKVILWHMHAACSLTYLFPVPGVQQQLDLIE